MKTYFISDTHFNHKNIIAYENRPFNSVEEMNRVMVENWNKTVSKNDTVFFLGDLSFNQDKETLKVLLASLNGHKILIIGNHDRKYTAEVWREIGFEEAYIYPIIYKDFFILSHNPLYMNANMPYVNIHGHIHSNNNTLSNYVNVSVEQINYTPISFEDIVKRFNNE